MNETWKHVLGWQGFYEVSDHGNVRSVDREVEQRNGVKRRFSGRMLRQSNLNGYRTVSLNRPGVNERRTVHRMVLEAFVGPRPEGLEACHANHDRKDNRLENLRWDTRKANAEDRIHAGNAIGWNAEKTHCKHGHEFTPENTYVHRGERACRTCRSARARAAYRANPDRARKYARDYYRRNYAKGSQ